MWHHLLSTEKRLGHTGAGRVRLLYCSERLRFVWTVQARRFLQNFHNRSCQELRESLDVEKWKAAEVPLQIQKLVDRYPKLTIVRIDLTNVRHFHNFLNYFLPTADLFSSRAVKEVQLKRRRVVQTGILAIGIHQMYDG